MDDKEVLDDTGRCTSYARFYEFTGLNFWARPPVRDTESLERTMVERRCVLDAEHHEGAHQVESPDGRQVMIPGPQ